MGRRPIRRSQGGTPSPTRYTLTHTPCRQTHSQAHAARRLAPAPGLHPSRRIQRGSVRLPHPTSAASRYHHGRWLTKFVPGSRRPRRGDRSSRDGASEMFAPLRVSLRLGARTAGPTSAAHRRALPDPVRRGDEARSGATGHRPPTVCTWVSVSPPRRSDSPCSGILGGPLRISRNGASGLAAPPELGRPPWAALALNCSKSVMRSTAAAQEWREWCEHPARRREPFPGGRGRPQKSDAALTTARRTMPFLPAPASVPKLNTVAGSMPQPRPAGPASGARAAGLHGGIRAGAHAAARRRCVCRARRPRRHHQDATGQDARTRRPRCSRRPFDRRSADDHSDTSASSAARGRHRAARGLAATPSRRAAGGSRLAAGARWPCNPAAPSAPLGAAPVAPLLSPRACRRKRRRAGCAPEYGVMSGRLPTGSPSMWRRGASRCRSPAAR